MSNRGKIGSGPGAVRTSTAAILGALALAGPVGLGAAFAQEAQEAEAEAATDEIIVTATKREENLQDVSLSIAAVQGSLIEEQGIERLSQIADYIPNVRIGEADEPARTISMRGLGSGNNRGFETSVGLFLDGAYLGRELFLTETLFDLQRVEAVRGPQGALYGKNTIAGALNFITRNPSDVFEAEMTLTAGSDNKIGVDALISGPITDTLSGRLAIHAYERDGSYTNTFTGDDEAGREVSAFRGKLRWEPNDNFDATVSLSYADFLQDGLVVQALDSVPCVALIDPGAPVGALGCIPGQVVNLFSNFGTLSIVDVGQSIDPRADGIANDRISINPGTEDSRTNYFGALTANYYLGDHTLTYLGSYASIQDSVMNFDADYTAIEINRLILTEDYDQSQHELRITSPTGGFIDYIAGLYYFTSTAESGQSLTVNAPFPGPPQGRVTDFVDQTSDSYSIFGQATFNFSDAFRLIGGVRYIDEEKSARSTQTPDPSLFIFVPYDVNLSFSDDATLINGAIEYDLSSDVMVYASYAQGFKAGGINFHDLSGSNFLFGSETSDGYELGLRSTMLDGRVTFNATAFFTQFQDLQTSVLVGNSLRIANAAEAISQGVEIEAGWRIDDNLTTRLSAAYLNAEYDNYLNGPCSTLQEINSVPPCSQDLSGVALDGAPEWSGAWNVSYTLPLPDFVGDLSFSTDVVYRSEMFAFNSGRNDPLHLVDGVTKLNARVALDSHDGNWTLSLQGTNLTDERDLTSVSDVFQFPGSRFGNLAQPRQWSAAATYRW